MLNNVFKKIFGKTDTKVQDRTSRVGGRQLHLEPLESREMLSISPVPSDIWSEVTAKYSDLDWGTMGDYNYIEITADQLSDAALRDAIAQAGTTPENDLIVVRTTQTQNTITLSGTELAININAANFGSVTIVSLGEENLTIDANQIFRVINISNTAANVALAGLMMTGGRVAGNGGGIYNSGTLMITDCTISGNSATSLSGYYWGGGILNGGTLMVSNSTISENTARTGGGGIAGGISQAGFSDGSSITIMDCVISGNTAGEHGGGIDNGNSVTTLTIVTISGNKASGSGGGIYTHLGTATLTDCTISGNTASVSGGGINLYSGAFNLYNTTVVGNTAVQHGGGIYSAGPLTVVDCTISGNTAGSYGGGIWSNRTLTVIDCTISGNSTNNGYGGGIDNGGGVMSVTNCIISENTATNSGGGLSNGGTVTITDCTISKNTAPNAGGLNNGGGNGTTMTVIGSTISENMATNDGGGIYSSGTLTVTDCPITENSANTGGGLVNTGSVTITNCPITRNTATDLAGGIDTNGTLVMTNSKIIGNSANIGGGGVSNFGTGTFEAVNCIIAGNSAGKDGGGINNSGNLTVIDCTIVENTASSSGGGIYNTNTLEVSGSFFLNNESGYDGGGVYNSSNFTVTNSVFIGNHAAHNGGGIDIRSGTVVVTNCVLAYNSASNDGGGIGNAGNIRIYNSIVVENSRGNFYQGFGTIQGSNNLTTFTNWNSGTANLAYDPDLPLFIDPANGDYRLALGSQAIDKGNNEYAYAAGLDENSRDLAGNPRFAGKSIDIGAYESSYTHTIKGYYDLHEWEVVVYPTPNSAHYNPNWAISDDGKTAIQPINGYPTFLLCPTIISDQRIEGTWTVKTNDDDDFMGFVFGYQDSGHFYLFDWKKLRQDWGSNGWGISEQGMSVKKISVDNPNLLTGRDFASTANTTYKTTLYRNSITWQSNVTYRFVMDDQPGKILISIFVDATDVLLATIEIDNATYQPGRFGFYNFSQPMVEYSGFSGEIEVLNTLAMTTPVTTIPENAGTQAVQGTVSRNGDLSQPLTVYLASNNTGALTVPKSVTIPAGASSASFWISAVHDSGSLLDHTAIITCTADYYVSTTLSLTVTDVDKWAPTELIGMTLNITQANLAQYNFSQVTKIQNCTITANGVTLDFANVTSMSNTTLTATNGGVMRFPKLTSYADSVTNGCTWEARGTGSLLDFPTLTTLTMTGAGNKTVRTYTGGKIDLSSLTSASRITFSSNDAGSVIDLTGLRNLDNLTGVTFNETNGGKIVYYTDNRLSVSANITTIPEDAGPEAARVTISRVGNLSQPLTVYLASSNTSALTVPESVTIPAGAASASFWISVIHDDISILDRPVTITCTADNYVSGTISLIVADVDKWSDVPYTATVTASVVQAAVGTPVVLSGYAVMAETGLPAVYAEIDVHVSVRNVNRVIRVTTDNEGRFSTTFTPLPGEGGRYTVFAAHPRINSLPVQCTFDLLGMRAENVSSSLRLIEGTAQSGSLTGLTSQIIKLPVNLKVTHWFGENFDGTLASLGTASFSYIVEAVDASVTSGTFTIRITSNEGITLDIPVTFRVEALTPKLQADTPRVEAGMVRGKQSLVSFTVTNNGGLATGDIRVTYSQADWLSLAIQPTIPSLAPGESATITLRLNPAATMDLSSYSGQVLLQYNGGHLFVPFTFVAVSDSVGNLAITVTDEYTYFTDEAPNLTGARVRITDAITGELIYDGVTGENGQMAMALSSSANTAAAGQIMLNDLREGYYNIQVSAEKHETHNSTVFISAGQTKYVEAFLQGEYVTYEWTVVPTEIEDVTIVTLVTEYEVNVPAPVVIAEPQTPTGTIDLTDLTEVGQEKTIIIKITNHGLIAAENVAFGYPTDHPVYSFEPLIDNLGTLAAKSSIYLPVVVRCVASPTGEEEIQPMSAPEGSEVFMASFAAATAPLAASGGTSWPCPVTSVKYEWWCYTNTGEKRVFTGRTYQKVDVPWMCGAWWNPVGGSSSYGGGGISIKPVVVTATCVPKPEEPEKKCEGELVRVPFKTSYFQISSTCRKYRRYVQILYKQSSHDPIER